MTSKSAFLVAGLVLMTGCGCSQGVPPATAYAAGHDVETKAGLAKADLAACKADNTKCDSLDADLNALAETGTDLQKAAVNAGYDPEGS